MTLDRHLHCQTTDRWHIGDMQGAKPLLPGEVILELKYRATLPSLFKTLLQEFGLTPSSVSKYRLAMQAWGHQTRSTVDA